MQDVAYRGLGVIYNSGMNYITVFENGIWVLVSRYFVMWENPC